MMTWNTKRLNTQISKGEEFDSFLIKIMQLSNLGPPLLFYTTSPDLKIREVNIIFSQISGQP